MARKGRSNRYRSPLYQRTLADWNSKGVPCNKCGRTPVQIDHIRELWMGGTDEPGNWQPLCRSCNVRKSNLLRKRAGMYDRPRAQSHGRAWRRGA